MKFKVEIKSSVTTEVEAETEQEAYDTVMEDSNIASKLLENMEAEVQEL